LSKLRVESCLTIGPPLGRLRSSHGVWHWKHFGHVVYTVYAPSRTLYLQSMDGPPVEQEIQLSQTVPTYGGIRWWFICPKCGSRASRLHKPPVEHYFWCRPCHSLTYESAQTSHMQVEKFWKNAAREWGMTTREARILIRVKHLKQCTIYEVKRPVMTRLIAGQTSAHSK
jgi:hypothetical protein